MDVTKYLLLLIASVTLMVTWAFSTQSQGGLRFSGNEKIVKKQEPLSNPDRYLRSVMFSTLAFFFF